MVIVVKLFPGLGTLLSRTSSVYQAIIFLIWEAMSVGLVTVSHPGGSGVVGLWPEARASLLRVAIGVSNGSLEGFGIVVGVSGKESDECANSTTGSYVKSPVGRRFGSVEIMNENKVVLNDFGPFFPTAVCLRWFLINKLIRGGV